MEKGTVTTIGMFDGVHLGHRSIITSTVEIARQNHLESMVITFDRHPLSIIAPGHQPLVLSTPTERIKAIKALGVDRVEIIDFDEKTRRLTAEQFIKNILIDKYKTRILVIGHDHGFGSDRLRGIENYRLIAEKYGIEVVETPYWGNERVCSSAVREYLAKGRLEDANRLLGNYYSLTGTVVAGRQIGRTIGFPTANIAVPHDRALPDRGVYAAFVTDNETCSEPIPAMVNIGVAPTITDNGPLTIEAHLLDFNGNLYGHKLTINFVKRLRDEQRFDSIDSLRHQLEKDIRQTGTLLAEC